MKKFLKLLPLILIVSCASKKDFIQHHESVSSEIREIKSEQESFRKDVIEQVKIDLRKELKQSVIEQGKSELVEEMKEAVYVEAKKELVQYQEVINQVLADKISEQESKIKEEITKALIEGPFISLLEEKIIKGLSEQQNQMFEAKSTSFIRDAVEQVLNEIVGKEIGIGKNGAEILK